jgi:hypothetical protein
MPRTEWSGRGPGPGAGGPARILANQRRRYLRCNSRRHPWQPESTLPDADIRKVVAYLRSLRAPASQAPVAGDISRGEAIFRTKGRCLDCHMIGGKGGFLGPDLSNIGAKRSLNEIPTTAGTMIYGELSGSLRMDSSLPGACS